MNRETIESNHINGNDLSTCMETKGLMKKKMPKKKIQSMLTSNAYEGRTISVYPTNGWKYIVGGVQVRAGPTTICNIPKYWRTCMYKNRLRVAYKVGG